MHKYYTKNSFLPAQFFEIFYFFTFCADLEAIRADRLPPGVATDPNAVGVDFLGVEVGVLFDGVLGSTGASDASSSSTVASSLMVTSLTTVVSFGALALENPITIRNPASPTCE